MDIAIKSLKVGDRVRADEGDIEDLAASMARLGQLQPIIITREHLLIAGGRRTAAAMHLGWENIRAEYLDSVDPAVLIEIELEENLRRKDLSWVEEVQAVEKLHNMKQERYGRGDITSQLEGKGHHTQADTAAELDRSRPSVIMDLQLAQAIREFPYLAQEKGKVAAWKRFKRDKETQLRTEQARRTRVEPAHQEEPPAPEPGEASAVPTSAKLTTITTAEGETKQEIRKVAWKGHGSLYLADSRDVLKRLPPNLVDCIVTDPPYALGMFKQGQTTQGARLAESAGGMYDDDPHKVMDMLDEVFMHCARILKPNGHAYVFFHMTKYEEVYLMLRKHFGTCEETPIVWIKNTPGIGDPNISWVYAYEPCFWVNRGRHLIKPQAFNYLRYDAIPPNQKIHPTQKPAQLLRHIISASCVQGEVVLDPFAGSGSTIVAACQVGASFLGIERHEPFHRAAAEFISEEIQASIDQVPAQANA